MNINLFQVLICSLIFGYHSALFTFNINNVNLINSRPSMISYYAYLNAFLNAATIPYGLSHTSEMNISWDPTNILSIEYTSSIILTITFIIIGIIIGNICGTQITGIIFGFLNGRTGTRSPITIGKTKRSDNDDDEYIPDVVSRNDTETRISTRRSNRFTS